MVKAFAGCNARHTQRHIATIRCLDCGRLRSARRAGLSSQTWPTRESASTAWSQPRCEDLRVHCHHPHQEDSVHCRHTLRKDFKSTSRLRRRQDGRSAKGLLVKANWNAEIDWQSAKVVESKPAARGVCTIIQHPMLPSSCCSQMSSRASQLTPRRNAASRSWPGTPEITCTSSVLLRASTCNSGSSVQPDLYF